MSEKTPSPIETQPAQTQSGKIIEDARLNLARKTTPAPEIEQAKIEFQTAKFAGTSFGNKQLEEKTQAWKTAQEKAVENSRVRRLQEELDRYSTYFENKDQYDNELTSLDQQNPQQVNLERLEKLLNELPVEVIKARVINIETLLNTLNKPDKPLSLRQLQIKEDEKEHFDKLARLIKEKSQTTKEPALTNHEDSLAGLEDEDEEALYARIIPPVTVSPEKIGQAEPTLPELYGTPEQETKLKTPKLEYPLVVGSGKEISLEDFEKIPGALKARDLVGELYSQFKKQYADLSEEQVLQKIQEVVDSPGKYGIPSNQTADSQTITQAMEKVRLPSQLVSTAVEAYKLKLLDDRYQAEQQKYQQQLAAYEEERQKYLEDKKKIHEEGKRRELASQIDIYLDEAGEMKALTEEEDKHGFDKTAFMDLQAVQIIDRNLRPVLDADKNNPKSEEQLRQEMRQVLKASLSEQNPFDKDQQAELYNAWGELKTLQGLPFEEFINQYYTKKELADDPSLSWQNPESKLRKRWQARVGDKQIQMANLANHVLKGLSLFERREGVELPTLPEKPSEPIKPAELENPLIQEKIFIQSEKDLEKLPEEIRKTVAIPLVEKIEYEAAPPYEEGVSYEPQLPYEPAKAEEKKEEVELEEKKQEEEKPPAELAEKPAAEGVEYEATTPVTEYEPQAEEKGPEEEKPPAEEAKTTGPKKIKLGIGAIKGDIKRKEEVEYQMAKQRAEDRATEVRSQWSEPFKDLSPVLRGLKKKYFTAEGWQKRKERWQVRTKRWYKDNLFRDAYRAREVSYHLKEMETTQAPGYISEEIVNEARRTAEQNLAQQRQSTNRLRRVYKKVTDITKEATFRESDLHKETIRVLDEWRNQDNGEMLKRMQLETQAVYASYDVLAKRLVEDVEGMVRQDLGETKTVFSLSDEAKNKISQLATRYLVEGAEPANRNQVQLELRRELDQYFSSEEFRKTLKENELAAFTQSVHFGYTLFETIDSQREQIQAGLSHEQGLNEVQFEIDACLGTLDYGPREKAEVTWLERRAKTQEKVFKKLHARLEEGQLPVAAETNLSAANRTAEWLARFNDAVTNEIFLGSLAGIGAWAGRSVIGKGARIVAPVGGSVVAGVVAGIRERREFLRELRQHGRQRAAGVEFAADAPRRAEVEALDFQKRKFSDAIGQLRALISTEDKTTAEALSSKDKALELFGAIADADARAILSSQERVSLYQADNQLTWGTQETELDLLRAEAKVFLRQNADNEHVRAALQDMQIGDAEAAFSQLKNSQLNYLRSGELKPFEQDKALAGVALMSRSLVETRKQQSQRATKKAIVRGVGTAAAALVVGTLFQEGTTWAARELGILDKAVQREVIGQRLIPHFQKNPDGTLGLFDSSGKTVFTGSDKVLSAGQFSLSPNKLVEFTPEGERALKALGITEIRYEPVTLGSKVEVLRMPGGGLLKLPQGVSVEDLGSGKFGLAAIDSAGNKVRDLGVEIKIPGDNLANGQEVLNSLKSWRVVLDETKQETAVFSPGGPKNINLFSIRGEPVTVNLPDGTALAKQADGSYNLLIADGGSHNGETLLSNIKVGVDGRITNLHDVVTNANKSAILIDNPAGKTVVETTVREVQTGWQTIKAPNFYEELQKLPEFKEQVRTVTFSRSSVLTGIKAATIGQKGGTTLGGISGITDYGTYAGEPGSLELALHWGANGTGIDDKGNFVMDVSRMLGGKGTSLDGTEVNVGQAVANGKVFLGISVERSQPFFLGTAIEQTNTVLTIPVDNNGVAVIDPNSPAGQFFAKVGNRASFNGGAVQVMIDEGNNKVAIAATLAGQGKEELKIPTLGTVTDKIRHETFDINISGIKPLTETRTDFVSGPLQLQEPIMTYTLPGEKLAADFLFPISAALPRRPLEREEEQKPAKPKAEGPQLYYPYGYYEGAGSREGRITDFIEYESAAAIGKEKQEPIEAIRNELLNANYIIFTLTPAIGDTLMSIGYVQAIIRKLNKLGKNPNIILITPKELVEMVKVLETDKIKVESVEISLSEGAGSAQELISSSMEYVENENLAGGVCLVDFGSTQSLPRVTEAYTPSGKPVIIGKDFLGQAIDGYNNFQDGQKRYINYAGDLLGDRDESEGAFPPQINPPTEHERMYRQLANRFGVKEELPNVAIIVESDNPGKQYPPDKWITVAQKLSQAGVQVNIIYNPNNQNPQTRTTREQWETLIKGSNLNNVSVVEGTLLEITSFLYHQKAVVSNDTGPAHIATALIGGPYVITLYLPGFSRAWQMNPERQEALEAPMGETGGGWNCSDDDKKWVSHISPDEVFNAVLRTWNKPQSS